MKTLNYIQFYYGGSRTNETIELPDDSLIFKRDEGDVSFLYKEKNCRSYNIIILSRTDIESQECICLGDWYMCFIDNVYSEYEYNDYSEFPKMEFYIIEYNFSKVDTSLPVEQIEHDGIWRISKFKGVDESWFYFSHVQVKDFFDMDSEVYQLEYGKNSCKIFEGFKSKVVYSEKYRNLYEEFYNKVLNKIAD